MLHKLFRWMYRRGENRHSRHAYKPRREGESSTMLDSASFGRVSFGKYDKRRRRRTLLLVLVPVALLLSWLVYESVRNLNFFQQ